MANYRSHSYVNLFVFLPLFLYGIFMLFSPKEIDYMIFSAIFAYGTFFMSPDMDLARKVKLFSIRGLLTLPFRTYSLVFKHRGISHWFLIGTITRLFWLFLYFLLAAFLFFHFDSTVSSFFGFLHHYQREIFYGLLALALADIGHIVLDRISSCAR